jgi:hypothetical protein
MTDEQSDSTSDQPAGRTLDYSSREPRRPRWVVPGWVAPALRRTGAVLKWVGRGVLALMILLLTAVGFGTDAHEAAKMRQFSDAVDRWQTNPDFRRVQIEYVEMGSEAMRTRLAFVPGTKAVIFLRSLPGLPEHLRVNDTSYAHYTNFTLGPLSAYMHLTREQGLADTLKMLKGLGTKEALTDDDIRDFLRQYKLHYPVVSDAGAVASVRSLLNDVDGGRTLAVQDGVSERLMPHIAEVAKGLGYPTDLKEMTPDAQLEVWHMLDTQVRETDYELWRTKQVNDWLNGVWAQVYGTMYSGLINPTLTLREFGRVAGPIMLMAWLGVVAWRWRKEMVEEGTGASVGPKLALEGGEGLGEG